MKRRNRNIRVYLCGERINRFSIGALIHSLERANLADKISLQHLTYADILENADILKAKESLLVLGFSMLTMQWQRVMDVLKNVVKEPRENILLVAGGAHTTGNPEQVLDHGFDVVFVGEAEVSFSLFIERLAEGASWRDIPGIAYRNEKGMICHNPAPSPINLDLCSTTAPSAGIIGNIEITRGCYYACNFCQTPRIFKGTVRHRNLESIVTEAERLPRFIGFISPNAFCYGADRPGVNKENAIITMLQRLRNHFGERQINFGMFPSEVRPDYVRQSLLRNIKPLINNRSLAIGVQSASDRILRRAKRQHTIADAERAIDTCLEEGFNVIMDFIFGLPGEDEDAVKETLHFLEKRISQKVRMRSHLFTPLPGTPFSKEPPGRLHPSLREFIVECARQKLVMGSW